MGKKQKDTTVAPKPEPLWNDNAGAGGRKAHLGVRWFVAIAIVLVASALIFRGLFTPINKTIVNEGPKVTISTVGEYAASFVTDWYTWDQKNTKDRADRLSVYNPAFESGSPGWNGTGVQRVTNARVFDQQPASSDQYVVTVRVTVDTSPAAFYVEVLALNIDGAYAVISTPTLIPSPLIAGFDIPAEARAVEPDNAVVAAIQERLNMFFSAWATGDATLSAVTKSGTVFAPLGGGITLNGGVTDVYVPKAEEGTDANKRTVTATATWNWPGGATSPATYTVELVKVDGKWLVVSIKGGVASASVAPAVQAAQPSAPAPSPSATAGDGMGGEETVNTPENTAGLTTPPVAGEDVLGPEIDDVTRP